MKAIDSGGASCLGGYTDSTLGLRVRGKGALQVQDVLREDVRDGEESGEDGVCSSAAA